MGKGEESNGKEEEGQGWGLKGHGRYRGGMGPLASRAGEAVLKVWIMVL